MDVRDRAQRKRDVLEKLTTDVDLWVSSVAVDGTPYLIPLSFAWDGEIIVMANPRDSLTTRNFRRSAATRLAIGPTRDVVMIDGVVQIAEPDEHPAHSSLHASRAGFDARKSADLFVLLLVTPQRIQAWRNPAELTGRLLMVDGRWLI